MRLSSMYHRRHWLNKNGGPMTQRCFISQIGDVDHSSVRKTAASGLRRATSPDRQRFNTSDLASLSELHPPAVMPNGNVGTPTAVFVDLIRNCRLPTSVIKKLGLTFPRTKRHGRFSSVPFAYTGTTMTSHGDDVDAVNDIVLSGDGYVIEENVDSHDRAQVKPDGGSDLPSTSAEQTTEESGSDDDDDTCEDWERHEALHADEFEQSRTKERVYEEKIELKWEKGGSGLVFYTDNYKWKEEEGDFDMQTADDWDVDMSAYYDSDPDAGDKDARDFLSMRAAKRRRRGELNNEDLAFAGKIGKFELHTKGVGRKILERQGWRDGTGLGRQEAGMTDALGNDGQPGHDKKGLGYHGEKLCRFPKKPATPVTISTIYDQPDVLNQPETLHRRQGELLHSMKYRSISAAKTKFAKGEKH